MNSKILKSAALALIAFLSAPLFKGTKKANAEEYKNDWMPFNYVLTDGFGSQTKYLDIRTDVKVDNGSITASGRSTKGGMGMTYLPEITLDGLSLELSVNSYQEVSPDRWFGVTFTDMGIKEDEYNEAPFYAKHSESWSNDYGAGILFAFRPNGNGAMQIQFNFIGINATYDADMNIASNAGEYNDGFLGWGGWLSTIQLYDESWNPKTDYSNIKITINEIIEDDKQQGYAFDINNGYWKRTDAIDWENIASDVFQLLDNDKNGELSESEKDNFIYGPAYETSVIPYANWGETLYSLTKFEKILERNDKRLYMSFMYKDTWDIRDGVDDASFTIHKLNGQNATTMSSFDLSNDKIVSGKISGTVKSESFHSGIYPEMVKSFVMVDAQEKSYRAATGNIESIASNKEYKVFNVKGELEGGNTASIIGALNLSFDLSEYKNAKLYKITGEDVDLIESTDNVKVSSSNVNFLLTYDKDSSSNNKGCKGDVSLAFVGIALMPLAIAFVSSKKKNNNI